MRRATMTASPASAPVPSWRLAVLIAVLVGFFFMHGSMAGDSCAGPESAGALAPAAQNAAVMSSVASTSAHPVAAVTAAAECGCAAMGTACTPLRAQTDNMLLALVLAGYGSTLFGQASALTLLAFGLVTRRTTRKVPVRALACVSRT